MQYCPKTRTHQAHSYVDATDPQLLMPVVDALGRELPDKMVQFLTQDKEGNVLDTKFELSVYKDNQTIILQEMSARAPMWKLPHLVVFDFGS